MGEGPGRRRRRRGGRGGGQRPQGPQRPPGPPGPPGPQGEPQAQGGERPPEPRADGGQQPPEGRRRRDARRGRDRVRIAPPGGTERRPQRAEQTRDEQKREPRREGRRDARDGRPPRDGRERDGRGRAAEPPVPQDPVSIELGQKFREAQAALRDAAKVLEKRKAEQGDEPSWLVEQLEAAEQAFAEAATAWSEHLGTTGRKVVRR